ncbi:sulfotransferase family protein [Paludisphaera soli]|uniref:sulfotransferase family protein n=1 Tax=Paludisphaera soli TaxID=2712865 RepID=UPI0013EC0B8A|nr:sulfotransferase [Paludisphaera soli]
MNAESGEGAGADREIVVVSGLPRSGTSLMMQMLDKGGIPAVTDSLRTPDVDNPRGYYEFEIVKKIKEDASWIPETRGKVFKMVSQLLYDLPASETYRIVFMRRDFDEMLDSQEKMLARLGRPSAPREEIKRAFTQHLDRLFAWLEKQPNMPVLFVSHGDLVAEPRAQAERINAFFGGRLDVEAMVAAVDPSLYRNRKAEPAG